MPSPLALFIIVAANLALGFLIRLQFGDDDPPPATRRATFGRPPLATLFASLAIGTAVTGWLALVLAEFGRFSLLNLALLWLIAVALLLWRWAVVRPSSLVARPSWSGPRRSSLVLLLWLPAALWLFFRPHQFIQGGSDAGVYVNLAASIAQTGGIVLDDPLLAELDPSLYPALLRPLPPVDVAPYYLLPGFYVTGAPPGQITPQFYPLHPVWQAVGYELGGLTAALLMTGLWALLGSIAVTLTARTVGGPAGAALALLGLSVNALQIWFARYPTTEMLTQYLLWTGLWSLALWLDGRLVVSGTNGRPARFWALLAGVALGQSFLVRIDTFFLLAIPVGIFFWRLATGRLQRSDGWFFVPVTLLAAHSVWHAIAQSGPYFYNTFGYALSVAARNWPILALGLAGLIILLAALGRVGGRWDDVARWQRPFLALLVLAVLLLALFGAAVRPNLDPAASRANWYDESVIARVDPQNVPRLNGYLSPLGFALGVAGAAWLIWRANRRTAVFLAVGLLFSLLYLWRISANPTQIYSMRRYVPVVVPFFIVAGAALLAWLLRRPSLPIRLAGGLLALAWLIWPAALAGGAFAADFVGQVDYVGLPAQVAALDQRFRPEAILLFNAAAPVDQGDFVGTPLRFLHGRHVFVLRDTAVAARQPLVAERLASALQHWQSGGREIYWVAVPGGGDWPLADWRLDEIDRYTIRTTALEGPQDRRPTAVRPIVWSGVIYRVIGP